MACIVGDGEFETAPTAGAWDAVKFVNPATDGAVLPILHLNGFKISNPTVPASMTDEELRSLFLGHGYTARFVRDLARLDEEMDDALAWAHDEIRMLQKSARASAAPERPRWPLIVLVTPKGLGGPRHVDGHAVEGTFRAHQVPINAPRTNPEHLAALEKWLRSYRPEELFDRDGRPAADLLALCPRRELRLAMNPASFGGDRRVPLKLPPLERHALEVTGRRCREGQPHEVADGIPLRRRDRQRGRPQLPRRLSGRARVQPAGRPPRCHVPAVQLAPSAGTEKTGEVWSGPRGPLRASLPGLAAGVPADWPARTLPLLRGVRPDRGRDAEPVLQVPESLRRGPVAQADRVAELPADLRGVASGPQRLLAPGPRLHQQRADQERPHDPRLSPSGREHPALDDGPLPALDQLHQRRDRREAADAPVALAAGSGGALPPRDLDLALGRHATAGKIPRSSWRPAATT